jgi:hypothetical protein
MNDCSVAAVGAPELAGDRRARDGKLHEIGVHEL